MFEIPVDTMYVWVGLAVVGAVALGLAVKLPTEPPPDATPAARTVDSVASSPHAATAHQPIDAAEIKLGSERIGLRNGGGEEHAAFAYDRVVPVAGDERLAAVLRGEPPRREFATPDEFRDALDAAETYEPAWRPASVRLIVRRVTWRDVDATLVGR